MEHGALIGKQGAPVVCDGSERAKKSSAPAIMTGSAASPPHLPPAGFDHLRTQVTPRVAVTLMADDLSNEFKGIPAAGGPLSPFSANVVPTRCYKVVIS